LSRVWTGRKSGTSPCVAWPRVVSALAILVLFQVAGSAVGPLAGAIVPQDSPAPGTDSLVPQTRPALLAAEDLSPVSSGLDRADSLLAAGLPLAASRLLAAELAAAGPEAPPPVVLAAARAQAQVRSWGTVRRLLALEVVTLHHTRTALALAGRDDVHVLRALERVEPDLLAEIDPDTFEVGSPSLYSEMVWECRKRKAAMQKKSIDWVVMRNRISMLDARNKRRVGEGLKMLSQRIGFRLAPGFAERVIYRELFPLGLTLLDLTENGSTVTFTMSHVAARQELRDLLIVLKLPGLEGQPIPF